MAIHTNVKQDGFKATEAEKLLKEIENLLDPIRKKAIYIEYGTKSQSGTEPVDQFIMSYGKYEIKVQVK